MSQTPSPAAPPSPRLDLVRGTMNRLSALREALRTENADAAIATAEAYATQCLQALERGRIELQVRGDSVLFTGVEVLGGDLVAEAILEGWAEEGLVALTIEPSVERAELEALARLLGRDWRGRSTAERDLEAEVWQGNFENVHFRFVARSVITEADVEMPSVEEVGLRLVQQLGLTGIDTEVVRQEVGSLLASLETASLGPEPEGLSVLRGEVANRVYVTQLARLDRDVDAPVESVSRCLVETVRAAPTAQAARSAVREVARHVCVQFESGAPVDAIALLRRLLPLRSPDLSPAFVHHDVVREELRSLWAAPARAAVQAGLALHPDPETWKGALFTLGELAEVEDLPELCQLGSTVDAALRQPLADALLLVVRRTGSSLRQILSDATDEALPVILLATRRKNDATLVEPLLARASSDDPRVREAVLLALRDHQSPRIKEVMRSALADPAEAVRLEALRYITVYRDADGARRAFSRLEEADAGTTLSANELRGLSMAVAMVLRESGTKALASFIEARAPNPPEEGTGQALPPVPAEVIGALQGLKAAGPAGRASLEALGRANRVLRAEIRSILGGMR